MRMPISETHHVMQCTNTSQKCSYDECSEDEVMQLSISPGLSDKHVTLHHVIHYVIYLLSVVYSTRSLILCIHMYLSQVFQQPNIGFM